MKDLLLLLILLYCHIIQVLGVLEWTVVGKVTEYGQNATLFCNVSNCCPDDAGWDRWTPVQRTLFIDLKTGRHNSKYDGKILPNGYTLIIQNLSKTDLNVSYSCLYGVTLGERKFLLKEDVFTNTHARITQAKGNSRLSGAGIAGITVGVIVLLTLTVISFLIWFCKLKAEEKPSTTEKTTFMKAINRGKETRQYVRIQVIGKDGVGKTSLVRRLLKQDIEGVESTDGIEINRTCKIRISNGEWIVGKDETEMEKVARRIMQAVKDGNNKQGAVYRSLPHNNELYSKRQHQSEEHLFVSEKGKNESFPVDENKPLLSDKQIEKPALLDFKKTDTESVTAINPHDNILNVADTMNSNVDSTVSNTSDQAKQAHRITIETSNKMDEIVSLAKKTTKKMTTEGLVESSIWDFAGQKDYYITHQTFFTKHAIYLLVADINDDMNPDIEGKFDSIGDYIDFWFDSIHCFCNDISKSTAEKLRPPVIMVYTGMDKIPDSDKKAKKTECNRNFGKTFGNHAKGNHRREEIHFISNKESTQEEFENLRRSISRIAKEMNYFAEKLPTKWIQLETAIAVFKNATEEEEMTRNCITFGNVEILAQQVSIEKDELLNFLNYQHKIGNIIFFEDKSDCIILRPNWLVDCFKCLVCDEEKKNCSTTENYKLQFWGLLTDKMINQLFEKVPELKIETYKSHILKVMEKFDIIVKPKSIEDYYMPCMITESSPLAGIKKAFNINDDNCTPWLIFEFSFLPFSFYNHILFHYMRIYTVCKIKSQNEDEHPAIYIGKAVFSLDGKPFTRLIMCFSRNAIALQVWKLKGVYVENDTYRNIIKELCQKIEDLEIKLKYNLFYEIKAKCRAGDYFRSSDRLSYADLNDQCEEGEYRCDEVTCKCMHKKDEIKNIWLKHVPDIVHEMEERKTKRAEEEEKDEIGLFRDRENLRKVSESMYGDRNSTRTTKSSTKVVQPSTEETVQLRLNNAVLEKIKLQHRDILKSKDAKIAELQQLLEQTENAIEIKDTEIKSRNVELTKRKKRMTERDIEIQNKEDKIKERTYNIRTIETERRKLHNQIQEFKGNIRVFCRVRPLLDHEKRGNNCTLDHISFPGSNKIDVVKTENAKTNGKNKPSKFSFDKVFKYNATQDQVFEEMSELVQSALDGYNVCIFAYGQTGSGKTYTMEGKSITDDTDDANRGMIPRSVLKIFDTIKKLTIEGWKYSVDVSCLEIYGKKIYDLLSNKKDGQKLEIQNFNNETRVTNITIKQDTTEKELYLLLQKASEKREVAETNCNKNSSRSHSVYTLKLTGKNSSTEETSKSTLYLVDLAGSEKTQISGVEGQQMKEAIAINQSLTILGRVIRAIKAKEDIIPYRESKLTELLQYSIGGNSKTLMFVNISPREDCVKETLNSLKFATEANKCTIGVAQKNQ